MYLMRQIGARGVYGNPTLPDFMVFLNWKELPRTGLASTISGSPWPWWCWSLPPRFRLCFFAFRSRVNRRLFSRSLPSDDLCPLARVLSSAMTWALAAITGLTDFKDILGAPVQAQTTRVPSLPQRHCSGPFGPSLLDDRQQQARQGLGRRARCREPHALHRLSR